MAAPQTANIDSSSNKQHQRSSFLWNTSFLHTSDNQEIGVFTKAWAKRNKSKSVGTLPSVSTASLPVASPFWLQRDTFIHADSLGFTPTLTPAALLSLNEKDYPSKRNILITNIPLVNHFAVGSFIKCFSNIKAIIEKPTSDAMTMVVLFYDIQQALQCYSCLSQLLQRQPKLRQVGLTYINNSMVVSTFDIPMNDLQDTHLFVSMCGPFSLLVAFDYMEMIASIKPVHHFKELEFTESHISLVVEYDDTRTAVATQKFLHGKIYKGIVFNAYLLKPGDESGPSTKIKQPVSDLQPILEDGNSCERSCGIHSSSRSIAPRSYSEKKNRKLMDHASSHWALEIPPKLPPHGLRPSISTSSSLSSTSSESSLTPPSSSSPSPTHSTFTDHPLLRQGSRSMAKNHHHHHPHHSHLPQHHQKQQPLDNHLVEVPQRLSAHLLGPLIQEFSLTSLNPSNDSMKSRNSSHPHVENDFDLARVINGMDRRTTFMIRNIPNKYDQAMLMEWIDVTHKGTYDFLYLRIDFKNKCNVGYAFINFIKVESVVSFAEQRRGKHWNRFNSQKICELSYAKIQGKANLIKKFQNSCVMEQEEAFRPKIFYSSGIRQGEQEPFPAPIHFDIAP